MASTFTAPHTCNTRAEDCGTRLECSCRICLGDGCTDCTPVDQCILSAAVDCVNGRCQAGSSGGFPMPPPSPSMPPPPPSDSPEGAGAAGSPVIMLVALAVTVLVLGVVLGGCYHKKKRRQNRALLGPHHTSSDAPTATHLAQQVTSTSELRAEIEMQFADVEAELAVEQARGVTDSVRGATPGQRKCVPTAAPPANGRNHKRALVVGINKYYRNGVETHSLRCSVNDAIAVHEALVRMGFSSQVETECTAETFRQVTHAFTRSLRRNDVAFFFFAGHGAEAATYQGGKYQTSNWLLSSELPAHNEELPVRGIDAHSLLAKMESRQTSFNALVLDCCRDDPLPADSRSLARGLGTMEANGSIIAFACAPGRRAAESPGEPRHGVYTKHLLRYIETPGLPINNLFIRVRRAVMDETESYETQQVPWNNDALTVENASLLPKMDPVIDLD